MGALSEQREQNIIITPPLLPELQNSAPGSDSRDRIAGGAEAHSTPALDRLRESSNPRSCANPKAATLGFRALSDRRRTRSAFRQDELLWRAADEIQFGQVGLHPLVAAQRS